MGACLRDLEALSQRMYVSPLDRGLIYLGLGDLERVRSALTEAFDEKHGGCVFLGVAPFWDSVRSEPFFQDVYRKIGLP